MHDRFYADGYVRPGPDLGRSCVATSRTLRLRARITFWVLRRSNPYGRAATNAVQDRCRSASMVDELAGAGLLFRTSCVALVPLEP